jgi:hypothetical protein
VAEFKFDKKALDEVVADAVKQRASEVQNLLDGLARSCAGKPVDEVKLTLKREWERRPGARITDPELTRFATERAAGRRIDVRT